MFEDFGSRIKGISAFRAAMEAEHGASAAIAGATTLGAQWREAAGIESPAHVTEYAAKVFGNRWPKTKNGDAMSPLSVRLGEHFSEDADVAAVAVLCRAYNATAQAAKRAAKAAGEAPKRKRRTIKPASEAPASEAPASVAATATKKAVNVTAMEQERATLAWFIKKIAEVEKEDNPLALLRAACNYKLQILDAKNPAPASEAETEKPAPKRRGRQRKAA